MHNIAHSKEGAPYTWKGKAYEQALKGESTSDGPSNVGGEIVQISEEAKLGE